MRGLHAILLCIACAAMADGAVASSDYIVKHGDTLWGIARKHKISYERLCALNNKPCDWSLIKAGQKITVLPVLPRFSDEQLAMLGSPYKGEPKDAKLLYESGELALFSAESAEDAALNAEPERKNDGLVRNSLFLRRRTVGDGNEWRLLLTSGGDWKDADGMDKWSKGCAEDTRKTFYVWRASFSRDGRHIWLVCDRSPCSYDVVCRFDIGENTFCVLTDGDSADEEEDGTIWVLNKKIYLYDKNGAPDGAAWVEEWITPDGKVVRTGEPKRADDVLDYDAAVRLRRNEMAKKQKGEQK